MNENRGECSASELDVARRKSQTTFVRRTLELRSPQRNDGSSARHVRQEYVIDSKILPIMPREAEPSSNEQTFLLNALREHIRLDGRALDASRPIDLSFGNDYGLADVRMGKTRVQANISAEVTAPYPDRKFDGIFTISAELSPMASPAFEVGR